MRQAVERKEFVLYYQPIIRLRDRQIAGFEALIRWQHPGRGLVFPDEFITVAEDTGLIVPMGEQTLVQACEQVRHWQNKTGIEDLFMTVNLSARQFRQKDLVDEVEKALAETGLDPRMLKLEITESVVMDNAQSARIMLEQLKGLNASLSVDDFGTGYSSLSYLHQFPLDTLKIDRSFISRMTPESDHVEIVRSVAQLAHNLAMDIVAEGVETEEQVEIVTALGCEYAQGYYFAKPMPAEQAWELLANWEG